MGKAITFFTAAIIGAAVLGGPASAMPAKPDAGSASPIESVQYYGGGYGPGYGGGGYGRGGYGRPRGARPGAVVRDLLGVGPRRRGYGRGYYGGPGRGYGYGRGYRGGY